MLYLDGMHDGCPNADTGFMCRLPVGSGLKSALYIRSNQHIQKRE